MQRRARAEGFLLGLGFIILYPCIILCQPGLDFQKQIDELQIRLKQLEKENQMLRLSSRSADSLLYCSIRLEIFEAFTHIRQLEFDFKNTTEKIAVTGLFTKLIQASNPASDILGFRFTDLVLKAAEKHFKSELNNEADQNRFSQVILKIINNPLVSVLTSSNPLTSLVSAIISTVVGFTTSEVNVEKEGGRIKEVDMTQHDAFDSESIAGFREDLQVYITFYDNLIIATDRYLSGLDYLESKYSFLISSLTGYKKDLYSFLGTDDGNQLISLTLLLPEPGRGDFNFGGFLTDPEIRSCLATARKYPLLEQSVSEYKKEYNHLLFEFLSDHITTLRSAAGFPDEAMDKAKTEILISEIESFIRDQKKIEESHPDAFLQ
jgi:hypothetical protein